MGSTKPVRLGIIGAGRILERFLPGAERSQAIDLAAIASRDVGRGRTVAAAHGIPTTYGSYDELLADLPAARDHDPLPKLKRNRRHMAADRGRAGGRVPLRLTL